jgi:hypothetical protein
MSNHRKSLLELALDSSSSDDEGDLLIDESQIMYTHYDPVNMPRHGGSVPGHSVNCRKREVAY